MIINPFVLFKEFNMYLIFSPKINTICEESKLLMNIIAVMIIQVTLTSQDKFIGALLGSLRKCIDKEISVR